MDVDEAARRLAAWLVSNREAEPGLTDAELDRAEEAFAVRFPPLLRAALGRAHPAPRGRSRPDWRLRDVPATRALVDGPVDGLLFDVEENDFWWHAWGVRPDATADRLAVARRQLAAVPRLAPLRGHLYVADTLDSPVFSIVQADLYIPARTLADLPGGPSQDAVPVDRWPIGDVPFWSDLHAYSQLKHHNHGPFRDLATGGL